MIQITPRPLTDQESKAIREWLSLPEARQFRNFLSNNAAWCTAVGGNHMVANEPSDKEDAETAFQMARDFNNFGRLIETLIGDKPFEAADLKPQPLTLKPE